MIYPTAENLLAKIVLPQEIDGENYDFHITFTIFGEIIHINGPLDLLPNNAQILMLGVEKLEKYEANKAYLKCVFPLIALGYLTDEEWLPVKNKLNTLDLAIDRMSLEEKLNGINDPWVRKVYKFSDKQPMPANLSSIIGLLNSDALSTSMVLMNLKKEAHKGALVGEVLLALLPFIKDKVSPIYIHKLLEKFPIQKVD